MTVDNGIVAREDLLSDWIVRLDDALHALDPTLGVLDFEDRLMPARFDHDVPLMRFDALTALMVVIEDAPVVLCDGRSFREPGRLAVAWYRILDDETPAFGKPVM